MEKSEMLQFFIENDKELFGEIQANTLKAIAKSGYFLKDNKLIKALKNQVLENGKSTLVINAFGGPGAGKSTACLDIVSALKKNGFVAEYVSEYAKELVWKENLEMLDGTEEHQRMILEEQYDRQAQLMGKCDIVVTDSPLLLNINYNKELTSDYENEVMSLYNQFNNFAFVVKRDISKFEQEGRIHNLEQSQHIDKEITDLLDKLNIKYGIYSHENINKVVYNASKVFYSMNNNDINEDVPLPSYNKADYIEKQKAKIQYFSEQIENLINTFEEDPEQIADLLEFSSKFYQYSERNTMLIYKQNKYAVFVQSFDKWKENGYSVKKGQKGLKVLVPVKAKYLEVPGEDKYVKLSDAPENLKQLYKAGKVNVIERKHYSIGNVYDISQTNCPVEKYPDYYSMGYLDADQDEIIKGIIEYCKSVLGLRIVTKDLQSISLRGSYNSDSFEIRLNELLNSTEKLTTLTHELGHAAFNHSYVSSTKSIGQIEFEADCFSIMLTNKLDIPITNERKMHLVQNFRNMENYNQQHNIETNIENIIGEVFTKYKETIKDLESYIDRELQADKTNEIEENYSNNMSRTSDTLNKMTQKFYGSEDGRQPEFS